MESLKIDLEKLRKDTWTEEEYENAALVLDFVQNIMNDHNFNYVRERFGNHRYKQHNHHGFGYNHSSWPKSPLY